MLSIQSFDISHGLSATSPDFFELRTAGNAVVARVVGGSRADSVRSLYLMVQIF